MDQLWASFVGAVDTVQAFALGQLYWAVLVALLIATVVLLRRTTGRER